MNFKQMTEHLADTQAINLILDGCSVEVIDGVIWRDTTKLRNCSSVDISIKYLRIRGLLCHHQEKKYLVKLKDHDGK